MGQPYGRSLAMHESAHASTWLWEGLPPLRVQVNFPNLSTAGHTLPDWDRYRISRDTMRVFLTSVIMAPILAEDIARSVLHTYPIETKEWPEGCERDAEQAQYAADWLGLSEGEWIRVWTTAMRRSRNPPFRSLVVEVANELERTQGLDQGDLVRIVRKVLL
jgi:DNA-directed RNA polymerase subunit H (RpoH/RPB5)